MRVIGLVVLIVVLVSSSSVLNEHISSLDASNTFQNFNYFVQKNAKEVTVTIKINNPDECGGLDLWISTQESPCNNVGCSKGMKLSVKSEGQYIFNTKTHDSSEMQWSVDQNWFMGVTLNRKSGSGACSFTLLPTTTQECESGKVAKFLRIGLGERIVCATEVVEVEENEEKEEASGNVARALNCATAGDGFYCRANGGYTWCAGGRAYLMNCAPGTGCNCGLDVKCDIPCPHACETGASNAATAFCNPRMGSFPSSRSTGYFCDSLGGYYQCVRDTYCPSQASPRSLHVNCPSGTTCSCNNPNQECLSVGNRTNPCSSPAVSDCNIKLDCDHLEDGFEFCGDTRSCNLDPADDLVACFWNADTNTATCAEDFSCDTGIQCNHNSDCPSGWICAVKSCCGTGICAAKCGF